jgi:hypothetical protein
MRPQLTLDSRSDTHDRMGSTALTVIILFFGIAFIDALVARDWTFAVLFLALCSVGFGAGRGRFRHRD